jgi:hypothetical protein
MEIHGECSASAKGSELWLQVSQRGNCLRVEVLRGEHLPRMDLVSAGDPYVLLTAQSEGGLQMFRVGTAWGTTVRAHRLQGRLQRRQHLTVCQLQQLII